MTDSQQWPQPSQPQFPPQAGTSHRSAGRSFHYHIASVLIPLVGLALLTLLSIASVGTSIWDDGVTKTGIGYILSLSCAILCYALSAATLMTTQRDPIRSSLWGVVLCTLGFGILLATMGLGVFTKDNEQLGPFISFSFPVAPCFTFLAVYQLSLVITVPGYTANWRKGIRI